LIAQIIEKLLFVVSTQSLAIQDWNKKPLYALCMRQIKSWCHNEPMRDI
jgi:hypothetical protein